MAMSRIARVVSAVGFAISDVTDALALAQQKTAADMSLEVDAAGGDCLEPGQLLFLHVMKNGGTSVDRFLACSCVSARCGVELSLGPVHMQEGVKTCKKPSVCSTHGAFRDRRELCGADFEKPKSVFTVMRDPVDRAFSFYNYYKARMYSSSPNGWQLTPIVELVAKCRDSSSGYYTKENWFMCSQLSNQLTMQTFGAVNHTQFEPYNEALVKTAKDSLIANVDHVFFMDNFDTFVDDFDSTYKQQEGSTFFQQEDERKKCGLEHSNPTDCPICHDTPTAEERKALEEVNSMDIELYKFAKEHFPKK